MKEISTADSQWKVGDIITLKVNFGTGESEIRKNKGKYCQLHEICFKKNKKYSFAIYMGFV